MYMNCKSIRLCFDIVYETNLIKSCIMIINHVFLNYDMHTRPANKHDFGHILKQLQGKNDHIVKFHNKREISINL